MYMILSMSGQARLFLLTIAVGFFIGFVYDVFRILRKSIRHPDFLTQIEDMAYWLFVTFVMFYFMLNKNYGEIRFFSIMGALLGMALYFLTLSRLVVAVSVTVICTVQKILTATIRILLFPVKILLKILSYPLGLAKWGIIKLTMPAKKILHKSGKYARMKGRTTLREFKIIFKKT